MNGDMAPTFQDQGLMAGLYAESAGLAVQQAAAARVAARVAWHHGKCQRRRPGGICRHRNHRRDQAALLLYLDALGLEGVPVNGEVLLPAPPPPQRRAVPDVLVGLLRQAS